MPWWQGRNDAYDVVPPASEAMETYTSGGAEVYVREGNVTITVEDAALEWARIEAAKRNSSVSRLVGELLAEKMRHLARTDVVTGLTNRAGLNQDAVEMLMARTAIRGVTRRRDRRRRGELTGRPIESAERTGRSGPSPTPTRRSPCAPASPP